ncbi:MAG: TetR/AcrR family transcriptional regulator [Coriobacteriales bacterium]|nr:TetR/AcrR family transcriptional regulator [Coriobacteriales bacterium]
MVEAGIVLADRDGLDGLSMRRLAQELGVNPMSIYHHLRDKDALLDAMLNAVVARIEPPRDSGGGWAVELHSLLMAARGAMLAHPWAVRVLQQRDVPTPAALQHVDRVLGILRGGGCSLALSHHALHLLGSRILGFSQDLFDDAPDTRADPATVAAQLEAMAGPLPHVAELAGAVSHQGGLGGCDDDAEFAFALDLLLEGLERRRLAEAG